MMGMFLTAFGTLAVAVVCVLLKLREERRRREDTAPAAEAGRLEDLDRRVHALEDAVLHGRGGSGG